MRTEAHRTSDQVTERLVSKISQSNLIALDKVLIIARNERSRCLSHLFVRAHGIALRMTLALAEIKKCL